jgi:TPR repeat protein
LHWYRKAAKSNHTLAQNIIGYFYLKGIGVNRDYVEAMKWYKKSLDNGCAGAFSNIGLL